MKIIALFCLFGFLFLVSCNQTPKVGNVNQTSNIPVAPKSNTSGNALANLEKEREELLKKSANVQKDLDELQNKAANVDVKREEIKNKIDEIQKDVNASQSNK